MASFTQLTYHIVFGTKYRKPLITHQIQESLYEYIGGILRAENGHLIKIGGADHVHLLAQLPASTAVADAVRLVKANSSKWLHENSKPNPRFDWQTGYSAFTVSYSHIETVRNYIANQEEHHRQRTFRDEYIALLERHGIAYRPEYVFEDEHTG